MTPLRRAAWIALCMTLAFAPPLHAAGEGRILATVQDENGAPVAGAKVWLVRPGNRNDPERTSDAKGLVSLFVLDAAEQVQIHIELAGFSSFEGPVQPKAGDTIRLTFQLEKAPHASTSANAQTAELAVLAYNEAVAALAKEDRAGAVSSLEQAIAANPKLAEAHIALAEVCFELKRNANALAAADRYLALRPGDPRGLLVRYDALKASGETVKSLETLDDLMDAAPKDPGVAVRNFNEGAERAASGDYSEAADFFERVVQAVPDDPRFAKAHYLLALAWAEDAAKKAQVKEHLQQFLRLAPEDPDAETAKQLLEPLDP